MTLQEMINNYETLTEEQQAHVDAALDAQSGLPMKRGTGTSCQNIPAELVMVDDVRDCKLCPQD